jgi:hypothetical protein
MSVQESLHHYQSIPRVLGKFTEHLNCKSTPEPILKDWGAFFSAARMADHHLDAIIDPETRREEAAATIQNLENNQEPYSDNDELNRHLTTLSETLNQLPQSQKEIFIRHLKRLIAVGEKVKAAENTNDYVKFSKLEGQITARLFLCLMPSDFQYQDRQAYIHILTRFARIGNLIDNLCDHDGDQKRGEIAIRERKLSVYLSLLGGILHELPEVKSLFAPSLAKELIKCFYRTARDRC